MGLELEIFQIFAILKEQLKNKKERGFRDRVGKQNEPDNSNLPPTKKITTKKAKLILN